MKLRNARLCLDCEDVHDVTSCPTCGSETFAFLSRWVPAPERPGGSAGAQATAPEQVEVYRELLARSEAGPNRRLLKRGLLGLTALGLAGWAWKSGRPNGGLPPRDR